MTPVATHILHNPLADPSEPTPSALDGVPEELERELRFFGGLLIQQSGILLESPQVVMSTAATLFQRFFFVTSLKHFGIRDIAAGALFLASKLEEEPLRLRDIINVFDYLLSLIAWVRHQTGTPPSETASKGKSRDVDDDGPQSEAEDKIWNNPLLPKEVKASLIKNLREKGLSLPAGGVGGASGASASDPGPLPSISSGGDSSAASNGAKRRKVDIKAFRYQPMDLFAQKFYDRKEEMVVAEMQILKRLGFHVQVQHPYSAMVNYLQVLELTQHPTIPQRAWGYLNDSLLTPLPALYPSTHLSTLSIHLAARDASLALPSEWFILFDVESSSELEEMEAVLKKVYGDDRQVGREDDAETVWERVGGLPETKEALRRHLGLR